jgi:hypothetical protein
MFLCVGSRSFFNSNNWGLPLRKGSSRAAGTEIRGHVFGGGYCNISTSHFKILDESIQAQ